VEIIKTIDLWTEQNPNHYEGFNGAFVDGFENGKQPFDEYKIVKNCNCVITTNDKTLNICNKHNAIVFYLKKVPVRLFVINKNTETERLIELALSQTFGNTKLKSEFEQHKIKFNSVDMKQKPVYNGSDLSKEIDVGSCDRWSLLCLMLRGHYTESITPYGNFANDQYEFLPSLDIKYALQTDSEKFEITHSCAFINAIKTRLIPIQNNSPLTK